VKAAPFAYHRPTTLDEALACLSERPGARIIAGGQSLGPMLNLRLATPDLIVDISGLRELKQADLSDGALRIGACVTHADVEDGRAPDATRGAMQRVAAGIAYRAVRNRGTIGGSLSHADPSADWVSALTAMNARLTLRSANGVRALDIASFILGALTPDLQPGEIVETIVVPSLTKSSRWGYAKSCRKTGEFADAIGVALIDLDAATARLVVGAVAGRPLVIPDAAELFGGVVDCDFARRFDSRLADQRLQEAGLSEVVDRHVHVTILRRAVMEACA
jgi:aerobic carbon-monoxide dehydrogenase medium subunit